MVDNFLAQLPDFSIGQWLIVYVIFLWTGIVRSGLGFGGAALGLPLLLLIEPDITLWLPAIGWHLLCFSALTIYDDWADVDGRFLLRSMRWILIPKFLGIWGILSLPPAWTALFIYSLALFYGIQWMRNIAFKSNSVWRDRVLLSVGGYTSGVALSGAPIIVAVYARYVSRFKLRATLFALWMVLVIFKMTSFWFFGVSLQWQLALIVTPVVALGNYWGLIFHKKMVQDEVKTRRVMGAALSLICILGLWSLIDAGDF